MMPLTTKEITEIDKTYELKGYKKSHNFHIGYRHYEAYQEDLAMAAFIRGAKDDSCVACMFFSAFLHHESNNVHLSVPLSLEGAIRGQNGCMMILINIYEMTKPQPALAAALMSFWV